ncbi:MAG: SRPBCC family protein [Tepidiformaceae bacterium]
MKHSQSFQVNAPMDTVWRILAGIEHYPTWAPTFDRVEFPAGKDLAKGLRVRLWVKGAPPSKFVVTEYTEGSRFAWETTARGVHALADHRIEPSDGGTRLTLSVEASGFMATLFAPMIKRVTLRNLELEGNGLKAHAEALVPVQARLGV